MGAIPRLQEVLDRLRADRAATEDTLRATAARAAGARDAASQHATERFQDNANALRAHLEDHDAAMVDGWQSPRWSTWSSDATELPAWIRIGSLWDRGEEIAPALVPFVGSYRPLVIRSRGEANAAVARSLLQAITIRAALMLPHAVHLHLVDPAREGRTFPMTGYLVNVAPRSGDVRNDLDRVFDDCARITSTYPDAPLDRLPAEIRLTEKFNLVVAADFPRQYDSRAVEAIHRVERVAMAGGLLVVHHDLDADRPGDRDDLSLEDPYVIDVLGPEAEVTWHGLRCRLKLDADPGSERSSELLAPLAASTPSEPIVPHTSIVDPDPATWWTETSEQRVEAHVGRAGASGTLSVVFGVDADGRPRAHAAQAATTGAGKSTLFHALIASLTTRYSPEELRLYLIDGKDGTEFQVYEQLPHAEVVSLQTPPELARSVVVELVDEMERRNALFQAAGLDTKVRDFSYYRANVGALPRLLLIIDEYQGLFEDDLDNVASNALRALAEKGRSAGIHVYIASQGFAVPGMLNRDAVFRNIHTRIALEMAQEELDSLTEFRSAGRSLIRSHCTHVGRAVVNSRGGADDANRAGKIALFGAEALAEIIPTVTSKADAAGIHRRPVVFRGREQPRIADSSVIRALADLDDQSPSSLEHLARANWVDGGFEQPGWLAAERPLPFLLGRGLTVRSSTLAVLEPRAAENLLFVGAQAEVLAASAASAVLSAALSRPPGGFELVIIDSLPSGGTWDDLLGGPVAEAVRALGHAVTIASGSNDALASAMEHLLEETRRRATLSDGERAEEPTIVLVGVDLDRMSMLAQIDADYGPEPSPTGDKLRAILDQGPSVGVHAWLGVRSMAGFTRILPERLVRLFRHRASLQISEDDSFALYGTSRGSSVQGVDAQPIRALYVDTQSGRSVPFLPHSTARQDDGAFDDDVIALGKLAAGRRGALQR